MRFKHQSVLILFYRFLGKTLEPPSEENVISAIKRLQDVGAFDNSQNLTALGHHLAELPVDVRIGKLMLFGAIFQVSFFFFLKFISNLLMFFFFFQVC